MLYISYQGPCGEDDLRLLRDGEVWTFGANEGGSPGWSGRANFLSVAAIVVLGGFGFAVQYGMFKDWQSYSS